MFVIMLCLFFLLRELRSIKMAVQRDANRRRNRQIHYLFPDRQDAVQLQCQVQRGQLNGQGFTKHMGLMTVVSVGM